MLRDRPELFGSVASTATAWRVLDSIGPARLQAVRGARAGAAVGAARRGLRADPGVAGRRPGLAGLRLMVHATLVTCHSEKELASATFKGGFGFHPLTVWLDNTSEALAAAC